jgi:hypothetical protein
MIKKIDHGIQWDDMEVTCLCEDPQGRFFMRVKRGTTQTDFYITKGGSLKIQESKKIKREVAG